MTKGKLDALERDRYIKWHEDNANNDLGDARAILDKSQKWAIIAGYYAMHNAAKYYLGKVFGIKIDAPGAHIDVLPILREKLPKKPTFDEIQKLIVKAEEEFESLTGADASTVITQYKLGKEKREKQSYYTRFAGRKEDAKDFLDNTVEPFMKIIMELNE